MARSAPDGYTLLLTPEHTFTVNSFLYRKLSYDPVKDFAPVSGVVTISQTLVVHPSQRARTLIPNIYGAMPGSPDEFAAHICADAARWKKMIEDAKIVAED